MRLRTKLFINIGALFFIVIVLSYILENYMTKKSLVKSVDELKHKIEKINEQKRKDIEKYLSGILMQKEAMINALLLRIHNFDPLRSAFEFTEEEYYKNIWLQSSTLLSSNKWIDLVQTRFNGQLSSLIAVDSHPLKRASLIEVDPGVFMAIAPQEDDRHKAYFAIPMTISDFLANIPPIKNPVDQTKFYALFSQESLKHIDTKHMRFRVLNLSINPLEPYIHWLEADYPKTPIAEFVKDIEKAQKFIKQRSSFLNEAVQKKKFSDVAALHNQEEVQLQQFISRLDQIGMIWGLTTLISSGPFHFNPFNPFTPVGFLRKAPESPLSVVLYKDQVFFDQGFISLKSGEENEPFQERLSVILPQDKKELFFGNTLTIHSQNNRADITVGVNGGSILKDLSLTTQTISAFISKDILTSAYDKDGQVIDPDTFSKENIDQMLSDNVGIISYQGHSFYYIHMKPFQHQDFHFFILTPFSEEFGLVNSLSQDAKTLISSISMQMRLGALGALIVVLITLSQIAKKVTRPISILAKATHFVKEGQLDEVHIPELKKASKKNEVDVLYQSFSDMVAGLKEKERVRGVLNKVVSQEIADEILKDETHLGGQEKEVTVFFADIRNFTSLTEKMAPQEVIDLLNHCMTKVSQVIDKYHGVIDKFVGDEVMALFGAPISKPESSLHAVLCALEVKDVLNAWNDERRRQGLSQVEMGIGIHKGLMVAGNMGAEDRLNYTVLGSNVNLGARLCSLAKPQEILISKEVYQAVNVAQTVEVNKLEHISLKGFSEEFEVYKVLSKK